MINWKKCSPLHHIFGINRVIISHMNLLITMARLQIISVRILSVRARTIIRGCCGPGSISLIPGSTRAAASWHLITVIIEPKPLLSAMDWKPARATCYRSRSQICQKVVGFFEWSLHDKEGTRYAGTYQCPSRLQYRPSSGERAVVCPVLGRQMMSMGKDSVLLLTSTMFASLPTEPDEIDDTNNR